MNIHRTFAARLIAVMLAGTSLYAAQAQAEPQQVQTVSGGVGESGMNDIAAVQKQYSLKLIFARDNGEYLADVGVQVRDSKGRTVLNTSSRGPVLLINLTAGSYKVSASLNGETKTQRVVVHDHGLVTQFIRLHGTES